MKYNYSLIKIIKDLKLAYKKIKLANDELPAFKVLMKALSVSMGEAQKLIDKKRLFCDEILVTQKNQILKGKIELIVYENAPLGEKPIFDNQNLAIFDKKSGVLSHPNGRNCPYSLSDEIWHLYGKEACVAHRLDRETSGLILVAKNKKTQIVLKTMFEKRQIQKEYLALVQGKTPLEFEVNVPLALGKDYDEFKTRMRICPLSEGGKEAYTEFKRLEFFEDLNASLVLARPLTGRQHQIRLHLFHMKHKILGESLYGLEKAQIESILDKKINPIDRVKLTGAKRLCLHSHRLVFEFGGEKFDIVSPKEMWAEFLSAVLCK